MKKHLFFAVSLLVSTTALAQTTSPLEVKAANGAIGIITIRGGNKDVAAIGEINSQLDFASNDGSVNNTNHIGGRIASITEYKNGAFTGLAFYTFQQSRPVNLQEAMRIDNKGNVGIGTITPTEKLAVNGKIRAKEIKVETASWPDYVFADDYKQISVTELEDYIKLNKHLPGMPTAKEAGANGIELGEMNKQLLKKMEEMTLLMIEQHKKIEAFSEEINKLKDTVSKLEQH